MVRTLFADALSQGLLGVIPSGSNYYRAAVGGLNQLGMVTCGSGDREVGNATGYPCMFFDRSESYQDITSVRQCGTEYTVSEIQRVSSSVLYIKLSGITDVTSIGIIEQGIPLYISTALTGTNISPLPTGVIYTSNVINPSDKSYFQISATTSAGTIGSFQSVTTGKVKYGVTNQYNIAEGTSKVLIIRSGGNVDTQGSGITVKGVTGFHNDCNGIFRVDEFVNNDSYYNKIKITHGLGSGSYEGNGSMLFATQSYATPYIAAQLAWMKDKMTEQSGVTANWYDVLGNAIKTSSSGGVFDTYSGYGYLNATVGRDTNIDRELTTPVLVNDSAGEYNGTGSILMHWNLIPYAESYELYFRGELLATLKAHFTTYTYQTSVRKSASRKNLFKVRAVKGDVYSEFSNEIELPFYFNSGFLAKNYD